MPNASIRPKSSLLPLSFFFSYLRSLWSCFSFLRYPLVLTGIITMKIPSVNNYLFRKDTQLTNFFLMSTNVFHCFGRRLSLSKNRPSPMTSKSFVDNGDKFVSDLEYLGTDNMRSLKSIKNILTKIQEKL